LFELSCPSDYVRIYNGENRGAQLIGEYNTTYMPDVITSEGNSLYVEFLTTGAQGLDWAAGFSASYTSLDYAQSTYPWTQVNDTSFVLDGRLGINTPFVSDEFDLLVNGGLVADELVIESLTNAPDYVFEEGYDLKSLEEVKSYIEEHGHLPEVPSADDFEKSGMSVSEMNLLLLKKIEELTLHLIELQGVVKEQQVQMRNLTKQRE
ncbi:MAG: CUB domain-containing protein, partial [Bacteroidota bacterium]